MSTLKIKDINKSFGDKKILKNINIEIELGKFLVLVGPSGCGKSTLLSIISGLEEAGSGDILVEGKSIMNTKPKDRNIGMVFQSYALYPNMNVYSNIEFGLKIRKVKKQERERVISSLTKMLHLENKLNRRPSELSGGERQRVAIARALAKDPALYLFDEPLSNLDAKLRLQMRSEIKRLHKRVKKTVIYVTHDQTEAMSLGDAIAVMKDGEIQQIGSPSEIYWNPVNLFTAGFTGTPTMNFIPCDVKKGNGKVTAGLRNSEGSFQIPLSSQSAAVIKNKKKENILMGIRPTSIFYKDDAYGKKISNDASVTAKIETVETMGDNTYISFAINDTVITSRVDPHHQMLTDGKVKLLFDMEQAIFFNKASGERLC